MSTDILEMDDETALAVDELETAAKPVEVSNGTHCVNCSESHDWAGGVVCPACGYHPMLKRCIEVEQTPQFQMEAGPENLWEAIPGWAWVLLGGVVAIVVGSFVVRYQLQGNARLRAAWAFSQAALAEFATLVVHVLALIHASTKSDRYSPFDLFMKPISLWKPTFNSLPRHAWRVWVFAWGQTAMICAAAIIGGMNYSALFDDWGVEERAKPNLIGTIAEKAKENGDEAGSLEEALDNAADAPVEEETDEEEKPAEPLPIEKTAECLIFGYRTNESGEVTTLLLASAVNGKMQFSGLISTVGMPEDELRKLSARMMRLGRRGPFVKCRYRASWLLPRLMVEVDHEGWGKDGKLVKPKFKQMLADIEG